MTFTTTEAAAANMSLNVSELPLFLSERAVKASISVSSRNIIIKRVAQRKKTEIAMPLSLLFDVFFIADHASD